MDNAPGSVEILFKKTGEYIDTRMELLKLKTVDKSADTASSLMTMLVVSLIIFLFIVIVSIGVALVIGEMTGRLYYGFFILGGFYGIIGLVLYFGRNKWLKVPFNDLIIKKML